MFIANVYLGFAGAAGLLLILPGPTNALLMTAGATKPFRLALPLIPAELAAYALAITPLLLFHELLGSWRLIGGATMKTVAIVIILLVASRLWRSRPQNGAEPRLVTAASVFWMTLFNPKGLIFAFAIFPPLAGPADGVIKAALFGLLASLAGVVWISAGRLLSAGRLGSAWISKAAALILCGFAIYLAVSVVVDARLLVG